MQYAAGDYLFFALFLLLVWFAVSFTSERGLVYRWRKVFHDLKRDYRGSKSKLVWLSLSVALRGTH
ncbi:hypothetical protein SAMN05444167_0524 [Terriglobus roseus]|uniref:Uncharacterized protein n=1 Tax=Terriglobus roseus TaxID=392734 RepID=A0A1G7G1T2_9BACT|nr:hypothetical protein SAMN05444167_0524 [Terriglobus roseus]